MKLSEIIPPPLRGIEIRSLDHVGVITELANALVAAERFKAKYKKALIGQLIENSERGIGCGWVVLSQQHKGVIGTTVGAYGNTWGCEGFDKKDDAPITQIAVLLGSTLTPPNYDLVIDAMRFFCANLKPNVHHVCTVADTFWIEGRGLVIAADRPIQQQMRTGEKLVFVKPDKTLARSTLSGIEIFDGQPQQKSAFSVKKLTKDDVPIGSEVWWINEGTAGAGILVGAK